MKKLLLFLYFILFVSYSFGQIISYGKGALFIKLIEKEKLDYSKSYYQRIVGAHRSIGIGFKLSNKPHIIFQSQYFQNEPKTEFSIKHPEYGERTIGGGIIKSRYLFNSIIYKLPVYKNKWALNLGAVIGIVQVRKVWDDGISKYYYHPFLYQDPTISPYEGQLEIYANSGFYILPGVSFGIETKILKEFLLTFTTSHQWGFTNYQEIRFKHTINRIPKPEAISYITGTSIYFALELKYDLKLMK